jgi:hypothetical protein
MRAKQYRRKTYFITTPPMQCIATNENDQEGKVKKL